MELATVGQVVWGQFLHELKCFPNEDFVIDRGLHTRYRLLFIMEGNGILQIGTIRRSIISPAFYCINEREPLQLAAHSGVKASSVYFHPKVINNKLSLRENLFDNEGLATSDIQDAWLLEPFFNRSDGNYGCVPIDVSFVHHVQRIMEEIHHILSTSSPNWPCQSRSYLQELLFLIRRLYRKSKETAHRIPQAPPDIDEVIQYLHVYYNNKIGLDELAKRFHTNRTTLNRKVNSVTGMSIITYVNSLRIQLASSMLCNTTLKVTEIMDRVGFTDDAYFIRVFRKQTGYTPAEYRKQFGSL
ncbi:helix-turn-helix domain-containing protein [Paenibacillus harenae]|uniref:helix-turn-helix domain-containing protein n=1 Tax=Paenibacillus harenae TaxID=306543 RepID=UPI00041B6B45|nr:AraC family transcriptional regulator [Paenibacillus harenae]